MTSAAAVFDKRRFLAPEVIQTSMMDCGPASLKCLLDGFGVGVSYGRLREACQTDVDGTSIDVMEDVAVQLGLEAEQVMVPKDHLLLPDSRALPAIVVVRLPHGQVHFVVVWRRHGRLVQVMDPGVGRRWMTCEALLGEIYEHRTAVPATDWREWAGSAEFLNPLRQRMQALGVGRNRMAQLIGVASADGSWHRLAALDAATRLLGDLVSSGGVNRGNDVGLLLERLSLTPPGGETIPVAYWTAFPAPRGEDGEERVLLRGAVLVSVRGRLPAGAAATRSEGPPEGRTQISPELMSALKEPSPSPWRELFKAIRETGLVDPIAVLVAAVFASAAVLGQALLFRAILDLGYALGIAPQRLGAMGVLSIFLVAMLLVEIPIAAGLLRVGRKLELSLRVRFLSKIPRISDAYFHSRLLSDMAERCHAIPVLRRVTNLAYELWNSLFQIVLTTAGLIWLEPRTGPAAAVVAVSAGLLAVFSQSLLNERDLRVRSHGAALSRYYLDALMGLVAIRAHGAERSLAREQENVLVQWTESQLRLQRAAMLVDGVQALVCLAMSVWLVFGHVARAGQSGSVLLVAYWALQLPTLAQSFALAARQAPTYRNVMLRLLEPLSAPEESDTSSPEGARRSGILTVVDPLGPAVDPEDEAPQPIAVDPLALANLARTQPLPGPRGVRLELRDVSVQAGGHTLVQNVDLDVHPSGHVAIVGASGAGKSTILGLLLGWHRPSAGSVFVDGDLLTQDRIARLRRTTAWVDPTVMLYNRRFLDNLTFGGRTISPQELGWVIDAGELREIIERLPDGLQTPLGEAGALVSGGEGQRIRLGRAMLRSDARLVLLDEPFRGLDRERRRLLLRRARELWANATLFCVTHDVSETQSFPRVLVVDGGRIVEDGDPNYLATEPESLYAQLLAAERQVREGLWASSVWRRLRVERGRIIDAAHLRPVAVPADSSAQPGARFGVRGGGES